MIDTKTSESSTSPTGKSPIPESAAEKDLFPQFKIGEIVSYHAPMTDAPGLYIVKTKTFNALELQSTENEALIVPVVYGSQNSPIEKVTVQ